MTDRSCCRNMRTSMISIALFKQRYAKQRARPKEQTTPRASEPSYEQDRTNETCESTKRVDEEAIQSVRQRRNRNLREQFFYRERFLRHLHECP